MPKLEQFEIKKYWQIFSGLKPVDKKLSYDQVRPVLYNSKLDTSITSQIWSLADIDDDDNLDFEEFVICMRLVFDMVNKNIDRVPQELPDWLVPGSKVKLIKQKKLEKQQLTESTSSTPTKSGPDTNSGNIIQADPTTNSVVETSSSAVPVNVKSPDLDWYISPSDKDLYEALHSECVLSTDGTVTFSAICASIKSILPNINDSDMEQVWKLVNPNNYPSIDKDPALYFIHILKQKNDIGCNIPSSVPTALRETFLKQQINNNLSSSQANIRKSVETYDDTNKGNNNDNHEKKYNTAVNHDDDDDDENITGTWGIVKLKRKLAQLDQEYDRIMDSNTFDPNKDHISIVKSQFQELLNFKKKQFLDVGGMSSSKIASTKDDLDSIEDQVASLENYLKSQRAALQSLKQEIQKC
ncbi:related to Actin cytoskeleton-regulatory complex protein END3 [Saccharomycodes ludwigii]|uniref:Actin cytoskeleton-regulatory complex protein END3 n=1 Tax=Saccharomycodes ludwigii TaxID=36035 RepID=A0A376B659_9ASCO|nr:hypothetical protein SCDLUD_002833 [Saccharomycodes ludwigii]KAH3901342.1 hypothetical protein SCDLUD_002833 [Saccharomycodes ludwigii]SSD60168.1 related to Actin cytoskeleton-regulatory complex protein END3 [Saccharomycodes ludwigii]